MPRQIQSITIQEVQYVAHSLAKQLMEWGEPIPDFETRYPNVLEACINNPFQTYEKKLLYKGLEDKATILFYSLIKNHPFQNGNKRIALTALLVFLNNNKKWLQVNPAEFYNFAVWVAQSPPELRNEVMLAIRKFIHKKLVQA